MLASVSDRQATPASHALMANARLQAEGLRSTALWYKEAIIYQVHVRSFHDSDGDGIGDIRGLIEKLDYIQDLGVTAIWMLPLFPSPLKDDGYDIADYMDINPSYGTLAAFQRLLDEAHRRELRVITELVMNHTSDQHQWFQRSRRAPAGSPWRDWYVWSDTPEKYLEARIIFQDFESSNWSWDPVAGAYFWHRFYSHQPDLNFDNPEVRQAMYDVLDFWLEMGVDGLRLDAVPYLFEREGANCENLPETHAFLRDLRSHIDDHFEDRMLLAEANQWPEDAAAYFGDADECHMNFHFPLMPRLFMAVEREDRSPIVDILEQTPVLPLPCQWAIFLRNHDELTLEMVTDEERDYMYRTYAVDARARINLGIRRRLAPLMGNNRRKIELMNALLLSLPGTPILYYGDEIGMGDNFYLGDRNGVRTPMHWSSDRNAGFSRANPQSLFLPVIIDPEYHYELRNVEVQQGNPHSLLWWMKRTLDLRKQHSAFSYGGFEALSSANSKVFAFLRETEGETLLIVANLSRFAQHVDLDLSRYRGQTPLELFGRTSFPTVGESPYPLSLGPHGFYWFCLGCHEPVDEDMPAELPVCEVRGGWKNVLRGRSRKVLLESLEPYLRRRRWFAGKARILQGTNIADMIAVGSSSEGAPIELLLVTAAYADGEPETYVVPVALLANGEADQILAEHPLAGILQVELVDEGKTMILCEAAWSHELWQTLFEAICDRGRLAGQQGMLTGMRTDALREMLAGEFSERKPVLHGGQQSNTSATIDESVMLKLFRRVTPGINPDLEIGRQLTEHPSAARIPRLGGALTYRDEAGREMTLAVVHEHIPNVGDAWVYTLDELGRYFERVQTEHPDIGAASSTPAPPSQWTDGQPADTTRPPSIAVADLPSLYDLQSGEAPPLVQATVGPYLYSAELLGRRTAELHVALATTDGGGAFAPEPFSRLYQRGLYQSMRNQARATMDLLRRRLHQLDESTREQAERLLDRQAAALEQFSDLLHRRIDAKRIRCHGDYHLGQVLFTGTDFVIIDFEGEPDRPVSERRIKSSPLRDVAGMLRSFHYAVHAALRDNPGVRRGGQAERSTEEWARFWRAWTSATFIHSYLGAAQLGRFLPAVAEQLHALLDAYLMEKALYELRYELNNRPDWASIPLDGVLQLLE